MIERIDGQTKPTVPTTHFLDNRIYSDPKVFSEELRRIFATRWKFVCHAGELTAPGDFRVFQVGGHEIIVLRGVDNEIRSFYNTCAHRGTQLVRQPAGNLANNRLTCFYHLWSYDDHGRCVTIPEPDAYKRQGIDKSKVGLRVVRVESIFDLVFVNLDQNGGSLEEYLGDNLIDAMQSPFGATELEVFHIHRVELKANWKLFVETNNEGYHELLHTLNRTTAVAVEAYRKRQWRCHDNGHLSLDEALIKYDANKLEGREEHTLPGMQPNGHVVVNVFPDVMLNCRSTVVRIDSLTPVAPDKTVLECRGLGVRGDSDPVRQLRIRHHNQVWGPMGCNLAEDIWATQAQEINMAAGTSRYSVIAREEKGSMDDAPLRGFYAEWSRLTGYQPADVDA